MFLGLEGKALADRPVLNGHTGEMRQEAKFHLHLVVRMEEDKLVEMIKEPLYPSDALKDSMFI